MINRGGESISATEIEKLINRHPGVAAVAVIPMPDPVMGERVCAYIEPKAGAVFTEPQYSAKVGETIAKEAGVPAASLDPVAAGPADAGLDYYEQTMRANLSTLRKTLGAR